MDKNVELDMDIIYGSEDYEELQYYFEHRKNNYSSGSEMMLERLRNEYVPDIWEDEDEKDKISDRQRAIRRISKILEEISPNEQDMPFKKTEGEG